ncbi:MAG: OmpA family protein [Spirochaetaceae bacterium]|nr:OmpA family protein [Spirochaetaceae bacterium]
MSSLGIAIDGGRYIRIDSTLGDVPKTVRLQTLNAGQISAKLDFCAFGRQGPKIKKSIRFTGLSAREGQKAELRVRADRISFAVWVVSVSGSDISQNIRIRTGAGIWPFAAALTLITALAAWVFFGSSLDFLSGSAPDRPRFIPNESVENPGVETTDTRETGIPDPVDTDEQNDLPDPSGTVAKEADRTAENSDEPVPFTPAPPETVTVYFSPNSADLNFRAKAELEELASLITSDYDIVIEGHCAEYGTERGRLALSAARAQNVADFLTDRIQTDSRFQTAGLGSSRLVTRDPDLQELNRRVEISLIPNGNP